MKLHSLTGTGFITEMHKAVPLRGAAADNKRYAGSCSFGRSSFRERKVKNPLFPGGVVCPSLGATAVAGGFVLGFSLGKVVLGLGLGEVIHILGPNGCQSTQ